MYYNNENIKKSRYENVGCYTNRLRVIKTLSDQFTPSFK